MCARVLKRVEVRCSMLYMASPHMIALNSLGSDQFKTFSSISFRVRSRRGCRDLSIKALLVPPLADAVSI
jgi:hypothetical protein